MTYKVSFSSGNNYSIKLKQPNFYKANFDYTLQITEMGSINDLTDVEITGSNNNYVLMYDATSGKWKNVNPDAVLSAATTEPIQPGLPADFENQLDIDLDNRIDLDAGSF